MEKNKRAVATVNFVTWRRNKKIEENDYYDRWKTEVLKCLEYLPVVITLHGQILTSYHIISYITWNYIPQWQALFSISIWPELNLKQTRLCRLPVLICTRRKKTMKKNFGPQHKSYLQNQCWNSLLRCCMCKHWQRKSKTEKEVKINPHSVQRVLWRGEWFWN